MQTPHPIAPQNSTLLRLEREVRNQIYFAVLAHTDEKVWITPRPTTPTLFMRANGSCPLAKVILTCREMHAEAASILYGNLHFDFHEAKIMERLLREIGSMRQHVRHICLSMQTYLNLRPALQHLKDCHNLCSLAITLRGKAFTARFEGATSVIALTFVPLFRPLLRKASSDEQRREVVNIGRPWTDDLKRSLVNDELLEVRLAGYAPDPISALSRRNRLDRAALAQWENIQNGLDDYRTELGEFFAYQRARYEARRDIADLEKIVEGIQTELRKILGITAGGEDSDHGSDGDDGELDGERGVKDDDGSDGADGEVDQNHGDEDTTLDGTKLNATHEDDDSDKHTSMRMTDDEGDRRAEEEHHKIRGVGGLEDDDGNGPA